MDTRFQYQHALKAKAERRRARARKMKADGKTWQQIGKALGVSRQRAFQLANNK